MHDLPIETILSDWYEEQWEKISSSIWKSRVCYDEIHEDVLVSFGPFTFDDED